MKTQTLRTLCNSSLILAAALAVGCSGSTPSSGPPGNSGAAGTLTAATGGQVGNGGTSAKSTTGPLPNATGGVAPGVGGAGVTTGGTAGNVTSTSVPTGGADAGGTNATGVGGVNPTTGGTKSGGATGTNPATGGTKSTAGGAATGGVLSAAGSSSTATCDTLTCTGGQVCVAGACQCPSGSTFCSGVCLQTTDFQTNPAHCGTCATVCATGATCSAGVCACPSGQTACSGACTDTKSDANHCGTCATACASGVCTAGVCQKVKDCYTKTIITNPLLADFESYDGTTAVTSWTWAFNAAAGATGAVYAGLYNSSDGTGSQTLSLISPGNASSKYAASISNTQASKWGGQMGMWMGCIDASAYQGISFYVQGTVPTTKVNFMLATEGTSAPDSTDSHGGGTCTSGTCAGPAVDVPVTSTWSQVLIPWSTFTAGQANGTTVAATGDKITGLSWNVPLNYTCDSTGANCTPAPSALSLAVDDIQFIGNTTTACTSGLTLCGTGCFDTKTNNANCGTCGNGCTNAKTCQAGVCQCPSGYTNCSGQCVNPQIDVANCGGCGKSCSGVCSAGSCQASSCTSSMPKKDSTSTSGASIVLGKYWINNNEWGASGASGSQSIWDTCSSGNTIGWGTSWNWSGGSASQVKSYASVVLGWQWGWKVASGTGLPVQLSANKNITCGWTFSVPTSQTIDVSYDLFAHSIASPGTNDDPTDEIMIWLYTSGGAAPIGGTQATVTLAGTSWDLHSGNNGRWNVYSYVRSSNTTSATLNLMDFLNDLVTRGSMTGSKYLSSIQSGTEVFTGSGELDTDTYYCIIQ